MPTRKTRYTRLETDDENDGKEEEEDESPPAHVHLQSSQYSKGSCAAITRKANTQTTLCVCV